MKQKAAEVFNSAMEVAVAFVQESAGTELIVETVKAKALVDIALQLTRLADSKETKRERIAAGCLQGLLSSQVRDNFESFAEHAAKAADALIVELDS